MQPGSLRLVVGALLVGVLVVLGVLVARDLATPPPAEPVVEAPPPVPVEAPSPTVTVRHEIGRGDTLGGILSGYGLDANAIREAGLAHHDLAKVRLGKHIDLVYPPDATEPAEVHYRLGEDDVLVVARDGDAWVARIDTTHYHSEPVRLEFTVESTLWGAATDAGLRAADIVALAKIFESDIDFNTEVQAGARVEVVVDRLVRGDGFEKLGSPYAVRFQNRDKVLTATRFQASDETVPRFYDDEGYDRRGAFLRSPLEFSRVTSGFSKGRYHPVLKKNRPHYGVDFGAPTGTPVRAVARGKVTRADWAGGHGRFVKIDHDGPYETSYSHLSKINVKKGEVVAQGQIIGEVGQTGLATGPHLHYQLWVGGQYKDPLSIDLPRNRRLSDADRAQFGPWRDQLVRILDGDVPASVLAPADPDPSEPQDSGAGGEGEDSTADPGAEPAGSPEEAPETPGAGG
ncbi:MAG: peptidoglycan DD-metalloendopeptidase family protein [Alphaproteobacteria bacterium]|nr:peptidoglycan DD-metalloendopeptidase family protein [Alphaproteobacteria bacterium]